MAKSVVPLLLRLGALPLASSLVLAGCLGGGGGSDATTPSGATATGLSGTVAVGAPMSDAKVRIMDAAGNVVASDVSVDASGHFSGVTLTGTGPFRIEACGHAGPNYKCVYSVAQGAGVANVTPLTTAAVLLAANESPEDLMSGAHSGLGASAMNTAQGTLRTSLSGILSDAGVSGSFDFVSGDLSGGSRTGYDRVLDAVGVTTGEDTHPFVQLTPRLGTGNIYMEVGSAPVGSIAAASGSSGMNLTGLETLFEKMTVAFGGSTACSDGTIGLAPLIDSSAQMSMGGGAPASGSTAVAAALCSFIHSSQGPGWGVTVMSPTLGRCDFTDPIHPVCQVSFTIRQTNGVVKKVGDDMTVRLNGGGIWKFAGSAYPIELHANATAQRDLVLDASGATQAVTYDRALAFNVEAYSGLLCAKITQKDISNNDVLVAYYKKHGSGSPSRLSVWRNSDGTVATNAATGGSRLTQGTDDTWIHLPADTTGDDKVRNFFKAGRAVTIAFYSDADCTTPMTIGSANHYDIDVHGLPPLHNKMAELPWPTLTDATFTSLKNLTLATSASTTFTAAWTFSRGYIGFDEASFCSARSCGQGSPGRLADDGELLPTGKSLSLSLTNGSGSAVNANSFKMLAMYGKDGDGMMMQSNVIYCTSNVTNGQCN
jgi:hypothetical protein